MFVITFLVTMFMAFVDIALGAGIALAEGGAQAVAAIPASAELPSGIMAWLQPYLSGDFMAHVIAFGGGLYILLWGLAEGLTRISVFTENTWDNKLAAWLSQATWILGTALGKIGKAPKLVIQEQVDQKVAEAQKSKAP